MLPELVRHQPADRADRQDARPGPEIQLRLEASGIPGRRMSPRVGAVAGRPTPVRATEIDIRRHGSAH